MLKIAAVGVCGGMICVFLKNNKSEFCIPASIVTGILIMYFILDYIFDVNLKLIEFSMRFGIEISYIKTIMKVIGISYTATFACGLLNDANLSSVALKVETACRLIIFSYALPIVFAIMETAEKILKNA